METIKEMWEGFAIAIGLYDAPPVQREEMKKAFYGGCTAMFINMSDIADDAVSEDEGAEVLQTLYGELAEFKSGLVKDYEESRCRNGCK